MRQGAKAFGLAFVCWVMLCGGARAQGTLQEFVTKEGAPWLSSTFPAGVVCAALPLQEKFTAPEGMEALYDWMQQANETSQVWVVRMPKGRVVGSVARSEIGVQLTVEELLGLWPAMVTTLSKTAQYVNDHEDGAKVLQMAGRDWVQVKTTAVLDGVKMLSVDLTGYVNCQDGNMVEIWVAGPTRASYRYDDNAAAELQEDQATAEAWLESLRFAE